MTLPEFLSYTATALSGGALSEGIRWMRSREDRKAKREAQQAAERAQHENVAIALLRDQLNDLRGEVARLRLEVETVRQEKHDAIKLLNAAELKILALKDEVNDELRAQGKSERYDLATAKQ